MARKGKGKTGHTARQDRGDKMHVSTTRRDAFASPGPYAGPKEHHIGPGLTGDDEYMDGGDTENERCESD